MTVWSISLWSGIIVVGSRSLPYIYVAIITLLIALILAATRTTSRNHLKMSRQKDKKTVQVRTQAEEGFSRKIPNTYFWILLITESLLILTAYVMKYIEITF
jgi:hypothetical protein